VILYILYKINLIDVALKTETRSENVRGDQNDVIKLARQALNRANASRIISKQECMVELTSLPLTLCSENIENVSISGAMRLLQGNDNKQQASLLQKYRSRSSDLEAISLCEYFHIIYNCKNSNTTTIPHFVGMSSVPTYPPTAAYAKATLIIHVPWRKSKYHSMTDEQCIQEFNDAISNKSFPASIILAYKNVKLRYKMGPIHKEPTQHEEVHNSENDGISHDELQLIRAMTQLTANIEKHVLINEFKFDRGIEYNWSNQDTSVQGLNGESWLLSAISDYNIKTQHRRTLHLPKSKNGKLYNIEETIGNQRIILHDIIETIKNWIEESPNYKPYHKIISGAGGTGKTYLIHQITTTIRQLFKHNHTVETAAFTGSAAYNIGGKTMHSAYSVNCHDPTRQMSEATRENLTRRMRYTVALIFDERSMISAELLGAVERNVASTCHGGNKSKSIWGGIPVVLLIGDDYQLPPVIMMGKGRGAFHAIDYKPHKNDKGLSLELRGMQEFLRLSRDAMTLTCNKRVNKGQDTFRDILGRVRMGEPTEYDKDVMLSLKFSKLSKTVREAYENSSETIHLFATGESCVEHNFKQLQRHNSPENPVAFLKHKLPRHLQHTNNNDHNAIPEVTCFSIGCKVMIKGKIFCPDLGLYNVAIGTVKKIIFKPNESPNFGHLPSYVVVEFASYIGHLEENGRYIWDENNPKLIPVPTINTVDEKSKQIVRFCPLVLSFARTIHTFQGQSAGPTDDLNKNAIMRIICDVGTTKFESQNIGLLYTALSRATTMGTEQNNRTDSAIYLTESLDRTRLDRLTTKMDGNQYDMIMKRNAWTKLLEDAATVERKDVTEKNIQELFKWAQNSEYSTEHIEKIIQK